METKWVLTEFFEPDVSNITNKILNNTKETQFLYQGRFLCLSQKDVNTINKILMKESLKKIKEEKLNYPKLPNLMIESIKQFMLPNEHDKYF